MEEHPIWMVLDGDGEEVMKLHEVLHSILPLQGSGGAAQKLRTGCGQNNIINIKEQIYHVWAATKDEV
jgi:hypothetical protein